MSVPVMSERAMQRERNAARMATVCEARASASWKPIPGFPRYEVSDTGLVLSVACGTRILSPGSKDGYLFVILFPGAVHYLVHRLVMLAFVGPASGKQVNHINGVRGDNRLANLEYVTQSENQLHRFHVLGHGHSTDARLRMRIAKSGGAHWRGIRPNVASIVTRAESGETMYAIAAAERCGRSTVQAVLAGTHWSQRQIHTCRLPDCALCGSESASCPVTLWLCCWCVIGAYD